MLRAAPCLFGLYTVVALLYHALPEAKRSGRVAWPGKAGVTFSDALMRGAPVAVGGGGFATGRGGPGPSKNSPSPCGNCCSTPGPGGVGRQESASVELRACWESYRLSFLTSRRAIRWIIASLTNASLLAVVAS